MTNQPGGCLKGVVTGGLLLTVALGFGAYSLFRSSDQAEVQRAERDRETYESQAPREEELADRVERGLETGFSAEAWYPSIREVVVSMDGHTIDVLTSLPDDQGGRQDARSACAAVWEVAGRLPNDVDWVHVYSEEVESGYDAPLEAELAGGRDMAVPGVPC